MCGAGGFDEQCMRYVSIILIVAHQDRSEDKIMLRMKAGACFFLMVCKP